MTGPAAAPERLRRGCGVALVLAGIYLVGGAMLAPERVHFTADDFGAEGAPTSPWFTATIGWLAIAFGLGLAAIRLWRTDDAGRRVRAGAAVLLVGIALLTLAFGDPDERTFPSGVGAAVLAGVLLVTGGLLGIVTGGRPSPARLRLASLLGAAVMTLFAILFLGLATSPRLAGGGTLSLFVVTLRMPAWIDRLALLAVGLAFGALAWVAWRHALSGPRDAPGRGGADRDRDGRRSGARQ